jgi:L-amino acid N-acyltransferase YncA
MTTAVADKNNLEHLQPPLRPLIVRDAAEADLAAIVEIYNAAIRGRISTAQLEELSVEQQLPWFREHSAGAHPLWIAEREGRVAGWLSFQPFKKRSAYRGTAEIGVYVDEQFRRAGVGSILLETAIARAPSLGLSALVGSIFAHNEASLHLFEQAGFERWGVLRRVANVDGVEHDVVIMGRPVGPPI